PSSIFASASCTMLTSYTCSVLVCTQISGKSREFLLSHAISRRAPIATTQRERMRENRTVRSGDGFVMAGDGQPRWGRYGAAGVLVRHVDGDDHWYFLARRSEYTHRGGSWAIPGGALDEG